MHRLRFLGVPCHVAVADDGTIVLCHPLDALLWHGHAANSFSVGIEIAEPFGLKIGLSTQAVVRYCYEELCIKNPRFAQTTTATSITG